MAFEKRYLDPVSDGGKGIPLTATYGKSTETLATVETAGYFNAGHQEFLEKKISAIRVFASDGTRDYTVSLSTLPTRIVTLTTLDGGFTPDIVGAPSSPVLRKLRETLSPDDVAGRDSTGESDDDFSDYFDEAVAYYQSGGIDRHQGGTIVAPNQYALSRTLTVSNLGVRIVGSGYGVSTRPNSGTLLKAYHSAAGQPVVKFLQTMGGGLSNLRVGNFTTNAPSTYVEFADIGTASFINNLMRDIHLGQFYGNDSGELGMVSADVGVLGSGTINGDSNPFDNVTIYGANNYGIDIQNPNISDTRWSRLSVYFVPVAFRINSATHSVVTGFFSHIDDTIFLIKGSGNLYVDHFGTEKSARLLKLDSASAGARFVLKNGAYQIQDDTGSGGFAGDARLIDTSTATLWSIHLEDFKLQYNGYTGAQPTLRIGNHSGGLSTGTLVLQNTGDIQPSQIDAPTAVGPNDLGLHVIYKPTTTVAQDTTFDGDMGRGWSESEDRSWETGRRDFRGRINLFGGPFKVKKLIEPTNSVWGPTTLLGSGATVYSYKLVFKTKDGHTALSAALTCTNAAALDSTHTNRITWYWPQGCISVDIYGRVAASEALLKNVTWDSMHQQGSTISITSGWIDDGSLTPSGAGPTTNTTGSAYVQGPLIVSNIPTSDPLIAGQLWSSGGVVAVSAGTGAQIPFLAAVTLFTHFADVGNVTTAETDLYSDTISAAKLATNGDRVDAEYGGVFVSSGTATRQVKIYFAGTAIFDTGALTLSLSAAWTAYVTIMRVSASVVRYMISFTTEGAALAAYTAVGELTGLTLANTAVLKITGTAAGVGAATNDIVAKLADISYRPGS